MGCADVGVETWFFFAVTTVMVFAFVVRGRRTQRWLRERPRAAGAFIGVGHLLDERYLWSFRLLFGLVSLLMWFASLSAVYCFFHDPDYPPLSR